MTFWKRLLGRRKLDRDLDDEIRAHLRMAAADRVAKGEHPTAAEQQVRHEFGNPLLVCEVTRDTWGWASWERFAQDFKFSLRQLRRSPGFAAVALVTLAL